MKRKATIAGLVATGWVESTWQSSTKYVRYSHNQFNFDILIGKSGAVRKAYHSNSAVSHSVSITRGVMHKAWNSIGEHSSSYTSKDQAFEGWRQEVIGKRVR